MQADRVDKSAMGFDYQSKTEKHESQKGWCGLAALLQPPPAATTCSPAVLSLLCFLHLLCSPSDYTKGFGGKFGVETDKVDKSAVGFEYQGKTEKHESQKGGWSLK